MFRRFLVLGVGVLALLVALGTPGQLHAQRMMRGGFTTRPPSTFRGGFRPGFRGGFRPGFRGGFRPGFSGGMFNRRFNTRFNNGFFQPQFSPGFSMGFFRPF